MLELAALILYLAATLVLGYGIHAGRPVLRQVGVLLSLTGVAMHALGFATEFHGIGGVSADFFSTLAMVSLLILLVLLLARLHYPVTELLMLALPGSAVTLTLKLLMAGEPVVLETGRRMLDVHIVVSLLSYSLLSIAAITAMFIAVLHKLLHRRRGMALVEILPPLVSMETLLFRMIMVGWLGLSFSLASGFVFVDDLFAQHLAHKTFLSIISWVLFGALLAGRWRYGWRGMRAVRLCLIAMAILVLAYFGSKAVLELILEQSWRAG
ncbi:MAG: phosphohydrolase [Gammaproteobacteria bacterium HGW-Gammaproteobacteria-8]|nr:MAG: phosphohydrolase [Gammaproteobacteria bacterium HGW-Gammaproteobacteria-8]